LLVVPTKRPLKKILYNFYWKENRTQTEIANLFDVTHVTVQRWLRYYKIPKKPRVLSCGKHPNSLKNLELGKTPEAGKKSGAARKVYSREKLIASIQRFVLREGRIPTKRDFSKNTLYPNFATFQSYFSSWNEGIRVAGFKPNTPWFALGTLRAKDGHICRSLSEVKIDDWLFHHHIPHQREVLYPEGRYRCDFVIGDKFVEFFGLAGVACFNNFRYDEVIEIKRALCNKHSIPLVGLFEKDLNCLSKKLVPKAFLLF